MVDRWEDLTARAKAAGGLLVERRPGCRRLTDKAGNHVSTALPGSDDAEFSMFERLVNRLEGGGILR